MSLAAVRARTRTYTLSGTVYPGVKRQQVSLFSRKGTGSYVRLGTVRTDRLGHWSLRHTYGATRTYTIKAVSTATRLNAAKSVTLKVNVK